MTAIVKVYNEIVIDMNPESSSYGETLHEDSFEYSGDMMFMQIGAPKSRRGAKSTKKVEVGIQDGKPSIQVNWGGAIYSTQLNQIGTGGIKESLNVSDIRATGNITFGRNSAVYNNSNRLLMVGGLIAQGDGNMAIGASDNLTSLLPEDSDSVANINNIAIGKNVMQYSLNGKENVAIGTQAMYYVGRHASETYIDTYQNVAIGYQALKGANVSRAQASYNVAIGYNSMAEAHKANATSSDTTANVCIGLKSGLYLSSGSNTFIGSQAGFGATAGITGGQNTAIGYGALLDIAAGTNNNGLGVQALDSVADGSHNLAIGRNAGNTIVDGSYNISIGGASDVAEDDNQIAIGYSAITTGEYAIAIGRQTTAATNTFVFGKVGSIATSSTFAGSGTCSFAFSSDRRRKTSIKDAVIGLDFINELKSRTFKWKSAEEHPEEWHAWEDLKDNDGELTGEKKYYDIDTSSTMHGFIAQELKEVLDKYNVTDSIDVWAEDENGMQRASESKLIIPLIKAVQELSAKVDVLEAKVN